MRKRLSFMLPVIVTMCSFLQLQAQVPYLPQKANLGTSLASADFASFNPTGDFTLEGTFTEGTTIDARNENAIGFEYEPTADGTYRFAVKGTQVLVFKDGAYIGALSTKTFTDRSATFPAIFADADDSETGTGIYDAANLLRNPGFETPTEAGVEERSATDHRWLPAEWEGPDFAAGNGNTRVNDVTINSGFTAINAGGKEGLGVLMFHQYQNHFYQKLTDGSFKSNTWYQVNFRTWTHTGGQKGGTYLVKIGTTANGNDIASYSYSFENDAADYQQKDVSFAFKSGTIAEDAPVYFTIYRSTNGKIAHFDRMTLVEATSVPAMNGLTLNPEVASVTTDNAAYAPEYTLAEGEYYDMFPYIANPDANNGNNGWTIEGNMNNPPVAEHWQGTEPANPYFDGGNWGGTGWTTNLSQTIQGLPAGKYVLKAVARASTQTTLTLSAKTGTALASVICPSVGSTGGAIWEAAEEGSTEKGVNSGNGYGWANNEVEFQLLDGEALTIAFNATTAALHEWFSVDQFRLEYVDTQTNVAPEVPAAPEITLPAQTKPLESGEYLIYHTASQKFLTSTGGGPVVTKYGYVKTANAYTFDVTVSNEVKDTITMKLLSSDKYVSTSASSAWDMTYEDYTAGVSRFLIKDVENGYNIASLSSKAANDKAIGMNDGATGDVISLYYDKSTAANIVFQFIKKEDFFTQDVLDYEAALDAYNTQLAVYNAKTALMNELERANALVIAHPGDYTAEATSAYETTVNAAREIYLNGEATVEEVKAATATIAPALNAYLMSIITADDENPADVSFAIINGDFSNLATGWNGAVGLATGGATNVYEMFQVSDFNMNQVLKGLPAGYYQLTAQGFAREKGNDKGVAYAAGTENIKAHLYAKAGDVQTDVKFVSLYSEPNTGADANMGYFANNVTEANAAFVAGKYNNSTSNFFLNEGEELTIGAFYDGVFVGSSWTCYDNFKLIYKGNTLNTLIKDIEAEIELAKAVTGTMQKSVATALSEAITAAEAAVTAEPANKGDLETAQIQLAEAVAAAKASIEVYIKLPEAIAEAEASTVAEEPAVVAAIQTANEVYTTAEVDADGIAAAIKTLKLAVNTQVVAGVANGNYTALIVNPTIIQTGGIQTPPEGWENSTNSGTNGNFTKQAGTVEAPVDTYFEVWNAQPSTIVFDYNQTLILPNGVYQVGAATFTEATNENAVLYGNEVTTPMLTGGGFPTGVGNEKTEINTSLVVIVTDNELRMGIKTIGALNGSWTGADFFTLTYLGADLDVLKAELNDSLAVATGLKATAAAFIVKAEMNKLDAAITEGNEAKDSDVLDEVYGAIESLKTAIAAARTSIELCTALAQTFTEATELIGEYGTLVDPTALQTVLDKNFDLYTNQTDETDNAAILAAKTEMEAALTAYKEDINGSGVGEIDADKVKVYVKDSSIVVEGADYEIYTIGGISVSNDAQLVPGVYIVKVAGQTIKVSVK